jgi:hypothetical protein
MKQLKLPRNLVPGVVRSLKAAGTHLQTRLLFAERQLFPRLPSRKALSVGVGADTSIS